VRHLLVVALNTQGYQIIEAKNGKEAVDQFNAMPTDAVIMDLHMPEMDGCRAIEQIRKNPHGYEIPIIVLTALDVEEWMEKATKAGANQFLTKPFRPKDLLHCLRTVLKDHRKSVKKRNIGPIKSKSIALQVKYQTKEGFLNCYLKNLMDGRSFVQSENILPLGSSFQFEISPPENGKPFQILGTVNWVNLYPENKGMGISFAFENPEDEERIQKWIFDTDEPPVS